MRYIIKIRYDNGVTSYYNGVKYKSRERAEKELQLIQDNEKLKKVGVIGSYIVEKPVVSSPGAINDIISICSARCGERCKACVANGEPCEDLKRIYWVSKPMYIENVDCDEETED